MELNFTRDGKDYNIRPATLSDAADVTALVNSCSQKLYGLDELEVDEALADWQLKGEDLKRDSILIFEDQELIAFGDLIDVVAPYVRYPLTVRVHPERQGMGFGWLINRWAHSLVADLSERAPGDTRVFLVSMVHEKDQAAQKLLEDLGGKVERITWIMERDLMGSIADASLPKGYTMRVVESGEYREMFRVKQEAFQDHWGFIAIPEEEGYEHFLERFVRDPFFQPELFFGVEYENQLAGMLIATASSSYGEDYGWIETLGILPDHRRKGIGKALLVKAFQELQLFGSTKVGLSVDSNSLTGAAGLYEQAGMHVSMQFLRYETTIREGKDLRRT